MTHRFINADSFASTSQGILGYNMFAYCLNAPVQRTDGEGTVSWHYAMMELSNHGAWYVRIRVRPVLNRGDPTKDVFLYQGDSLEIPPIIVHPTIRAGLDRTREHRPTVSLVPDLPDLYPGYIAMTEDYAGDPTFFVK